MYYGASINTYTQNRNQLCTGYFFKISNGEDPKMTTFFCLIIFIKSIEFLVEQYSEQFFLKLSDLIDTLEYY